MIFGLFNRRPASGTVPQQLYGAVMAQARQPAFYSGFGVPDTVMGRFDMLSLHMILLSHRLAAESDAVARELNQDVVDAFMAGIEAALREMGIGDTTVPKRKKRLARAYVGHLDALVPLLDGGNEAELAATLRERLADGGETSLASEPLAAYVLAADAGLRRQPVSDFMAGRIVWPVVASS